MNLVMIFEQRKEKKCKEDHHSKRATYAPGKMKTWQKELNYTNDD